MIKRIEIKGYKSIEDLTLDLGRLNVFIGSNGSGKSNILEAIAMLSSVNGGQVSIETLIGKGVRVAKPSLTFNSFFGKGAPDAIKGCIETDDLPAKKQHTLVCKDIADIYSDWKDEEYDKAFRAIEKTSDPEQIRGMTQQLLTSSFWSDFLIYTPNITALRGLSNESKKSPLGIYGEGLDLLISSFTEEQHAKLLSYQYMEWLDHIEIDSKEEYRSAGYKLGRSTSTLYFSDKFMQKKNNLFSAENANEGVLHLLFYLALFISKKTPPFFAIDNIETGLNPRLCRKLIKSLVELSKDQNKQALISTHNPAVLDGLNLFDEEQRLFVVKRTDTGQTEVQRVKLKPDGKSDVRLSELWMNGYIGGVPKLF